MFYLQHIRNRLRYKIDQEQACYTGKCCSSVASNLVIRIFCRSYFKIRPFLWYSVILNIQKNDFLICRMSLHKCGLIYIFLNNIKKVSKQSYGKRNKQLLSFDLCQLKQLYKKIISTYKITRVIFCSDIVAKSYQIVDRKL